MAILYLNINGSVTIVHNPYTFIRGDECFSKLEKLIEGFPNQEQIIGFDCLEVIHGRDA